jgi:hypothetical protein
MLNVILAGFAMLVAVVAGVAAAEGLRWALRAQPEGRTERLPGD